MANLQDRLPQNVPGRFYVDHQCLDHGWCQHCAPANFARSDESGCYYVCKQPETAEELAQCLRAQAECPMEAIGSDGESTPVA